MAFEGVPIGTVTDLGVFVDATDFSTRLPVVVEIERERFRLIGGGKLPAKGHALKPLVEHKGLRAQLQSESMVTGQRFIQLAFYPDAPPAPLTIDPLTKLPEIPTMPTTLEQVEDAVRQALVKIGELPLEQIVTTLNETLTGINRLVNAPEVMESVRALQATLGDVQHLVQGMDKRTEVAVSRLTSTLDNANTLVGNLNKLTQNVEERVPEALTSFTEAARAAQQTLDRARQTLVSVDGVTGNNSPVRYELTKALREVSAAARALRVLADYLERYPNAVLFGRPDTGAN